MEGARDADGAPPSHAAAPQRCVVWWSLAATLPPLALHCSARAAPAVPCCRHPPQAHEVSRCACACRGAARRWSARRAHCMCSPGGGGGMQPPIGCCGLKSRAVLAMRRRLAAARLPLGLTVSHAPRACHRRAFTGTPSHPRRPTPCGCRHGCSSPRRRPVGPRCGSDPAGLREPSHLQLVKYELSTCFSNMHRRNGMHQLTCCERL